MIVATLVVCLISHPAHCKTVNLEAPPEGFIQARTELPMACVAISQPLAAKWLTEHPQFQFNRLRCGRPEEQL